MLVFFVLALAKKQVEAEQKKRRWRAIVTSKRARLYEVRTGRKAAPRNGLRFHTYKFFFRQRTLQKQKQEQFWKQLRERRGALWETTTEERFLEEKKGQLWQDLCLFCSLCATLPLCLFFVWTEVLGRAFGAAVHKLCSSFCRTLAVRTPKLSGTSSEAPPSNSTWTSFSSSAASRW